MQLIITLRRVVANRDQGKAIFDFVREKLKDNPDIKVEGHVTNHFEKEDPPNGPD